MCAATLWHLFDLLPLASLLWTPSGLLGLHDHLAGGAGARTLSLLRFIDGDAAPLVFFAATWIAVLATLGSRHPGVWKWIAAVGVLSLHNRNWLAWTGGEAVASLLWIWALCLPLGGQRVDEPGGSDKAPSAPLAWSAPAALQLQLVAIYLLNAAAKTGSTWRSGEALQLFLAQDRVVSPAGLWIAENIPSDALWGATWAALAIEWLVPVLIISPWRSRSCRRVAAIAVLVLHIGIAIVSTLDSFSLFMCVFAVVLVPESDWARLPAAVGRWLDADGSPDRARRYGGWLALLFIALFVGQAAGMTDVAARLGLRQQWSMFAPDVPRDDGWMQVVVKLGDGPQVDLRTDAQPALGKPDARLRRWHPRHEWIAHQAVRSKKAAQMYAEAVVRTHGLGRYEGGGGGHIDRARPRRRGARVDQIKLVWVTDTGQARLEVAD